MERQVANDSGVHYLVLLLQYVAIVSCGIFSMLPSSNHIPSSFCLAYHKDSKSAKMSFIIVHCIIFAFSFLYIVYIQMKQGLDHTRYWNVYRTFFSVITVDHIFITAAMAGMILSVVSYWEHPVELFDLSVFYVFTLPGFIHVVISTVILLGRCRGMSRWEGMFVDITDCWRCVKNKTGCISKTDDTLYDVIVK